MNRSPLPRRIRHLIDEHQLFSSGDTLIVALSGGADSRALLDLLATMPDLPLQLVAAHLNHSLRGAESDGDELFCRDLAEQYALPFISHRADIAAIAAQERLSLEDAGRRERYRFLERIRSDYNASAIALGHHADDQAETILMRLLRGAGATGLAGMSFRGPGRRVRPLLTTTKNELESYLAERNLSYRTDASNMDTAFLRNSIRHELLPLLERYNPAIRERLLVTATVLADEDHLLDRMASRIKELISSRTEMGVTCSLTLLKEHPMPLRRRVIRILLTETAAGAPRFSHRHIQAVLNLLDSPHPNAFLTLPGKLRVLRQYGHLLFQAVPGTLPDSKDALEITGPGQYLLCNGACLTIQRILPPDDFRTDSACNVYFDAAKTPFPWRVRPFQPGDRIRPLGMAGSKKIKDLFIDLKIPRTQRSAIPMIFSGESLIWVCGVRMSRDAALDKTSQGALMAVYSMGENRTEYHTITGETA